MPNRYINQNLSYDSSWSNRILIIALAGIFFLTLYPFDFVRSPSLPPGASPFLLSGIKSAGTLDDFLNVLLFMPVGFGLAEKFREHGKTKAGTLFFTFLAGALLSYCIEFTQLFIISRDSGWLDVMTNSTGALVGGLVFLTCGWGVLHLLSSIGATLYSFLVPRRLVWAIAFYFAIWLAISVPLQMQTRLSNWDPGSLLVVGNDATGETASVWQGEVFRLQLWDQAFTHELARQITAGVTKQTSQYLPIAEYEFTAPPYRDRMNFLPDLSWTVQQLVHADASQLSANGVAGLASQGPVSNLVADVTQRNQFAIRVVCKPSGIVAVDARIASIAHGPKSNIQIRQEDADLVVWLRTPLTVRSSSLAWRIPDAFSAGAMRDILFSYNGSVGSLYVNGSPAANSYRLDPGTALASHFRMPRTKELNGYHDIYYALGFFPGGVLLGAGLRHWKSSRAFMIFLAAASVLFFSLLFELAMEHVSSRPLSIEYITQSAALMIIGILWLHADRMSARAAAV